MPAKGHLTRIVTTPMLTLYGIGNIVGAGVYVLIGKIAEPAGYLSIVAFLVAAVVAFCAALSYAELASRFPVSAGVSVYLHEAFKTKTLSTIVGLMLVGAGIISTATLLKGFAGYFYQLVAIPQWLSLVLVTSLLVLIMLKGIKESVQAAAILTIIEVGGLLFLVGSILLSQPGAVGHFMNGFAQAGGQLDGATFTGIISAAFIAFYAFVGFEDMVNIAEEVRQPQKAYPRAILWSMLTVTVLYILVTIAALGVLTPVMLAGSDAPLAAAYQTATGFDPVIIIVISLIATLNGVLVNSIMGSRFLYGMGSRGWIASWFAKVSKRRVPARGVVLVSAVALVGALWIPLGQLAQITSLLLLLVFFAVNVSLIVIRRRSHPSLRISPTFMPWLGAIASAALLGGQILALILHAWSGSI